MQFRVLGALRVVVDGEEVHVGGPRQRRLLAAMLIDRNQVMSSDRLVDAVFAGEPTEKASSTLRTYVMRLRRVIENDRSDPAVDTEPPGYRLRVDDDAVDAGRFERLVEEGRARQDEGDPVGAASALREALALWEGHAYAEFDSEPWAQPAAHRLTSLRSAAEEQLVAAELDCGLATQLVARLEEMVARDPFRESIRAKLMVALYRSGRHADALGVMRDYRSVLRRSTGLDPSPELRELEGRILAHDEDLRRAAPPVRAVRGYLLGERLGTGRDGTVYAARLPGVERDLVVRVVPAELADRREVVRSFDATMRQVASLHHEAIVPIDDHWRQAGGAYVVMRRMRGGSLRDRLEHGPLSAAEVVELARRVGSALAAAAERGIAHERVTPASVLFDGAGRAHLSDFPLAAVAASPGVEIAALASLLDEAMSAGRGAGRSDDSGHAPFAELLADVIASSRRPTIAELVEDLERAAGLAARPVSAPNPYKGMRAFDESDAADFFGRDRLGDELIARLGSTGPSDRLVLVVGASGSGKSSVVRAGVLPLVRTGALPGSEGWFVSTMTPGAAPFDELAEGLTRIATAADTPTARSVASLARTLALDEAGLHGALSELLPDGAELLLVVDQLEELFTLATEDLQRAFLDRVLYALSAEESRLRVVATLRADFYDRPLRFQPFAAIVHEATVTVPAMTAAELEETITGPASRVGLEVEPALVAELVAAVAHQPAAMPALQFTLYELAEGSDGRLRLEDYRQLGGVAGAIAARAEELYRSHGDDGGVVRRLFEQLVVIGSEGEPTRRPVPRTELVGLTDGRDLDEVIEPWTAARLLSHDRHPETREPTVEVAHEALLREWPRLRGWIERGRAAIVAAGELRDAARAWEALDRDPDALYRGTKLATAREQLGGRIGELPPSERAFLDASVAARDERRRREAARVADQSYTNRRLRRQLAALALATVVALVGGFVALDQRREARDERLVATARELAAASMAVVEEDAELAVLLGLEAVAMTRNDDGSVLPEAEGALHHAVTASRLTATVGGVGGKVDWHPDGTSFVTEGPEGSGLVDLRDAATGESILRFEGHESDVNDAVFSSDGSMLATAGDDGLLRVWDATSGEMQVELRGRGQVRGVSFSRDGHRVAATWVEEALTRVLDLTVGEQALEVFTRGLSTSFGPEGDRLAIGTLEGVVVVDGRDGERLLSAYVGTDIVDVAWSPDGRWIASASERGPFRLVDAATGDVAGSMPGTDTDVLALDWSSDGARLATGSRGGIARVLDVTPDGAVERLAVAVRDGPVTGVALTADAERLLTGDQVTAVARIWAVGIEGGAEWTNLPTSSLVSRPSAVFTPDGEAVVVTGLDEAAVVRDATTGTVRARLGRGLLPATDVTVSPDGGLVATVGHGRSVHVWDSGTGEEAFSTGLPGLRPLDVGWSPNGRLLAIAGVDERRLGRIGIVDRTGEIVAVLEDESDWVADAVTFDGDGQRLVVTRVPVGPDPTLAEVQVWDWLHRETLLRLPIYATAVAASPTGERVATTSAADGVVLWDHSTGEHVATLTGHNGDVRDVAFSADGDTVATAGVDGTVRLWTADSGEERLVLRGHEGPVESVAFGPDGDKLVSTEEGVARVWALDVDDLVAIAEARVTRSLTDDECRQYLHVDRCPA